MGARSWIFQGYATVVIRIRCLSRSPLSGSTHLTLRATLQVIVSQQVGNAQDFTLLRRLCKVKRRALIIEGRRPKSRSQPRLPAQSTPRPSPSPSVPRQLGHTAGPPPPWPACKQQASLQGVSWGPPSRLRQCPGIASTSTVAALQSIGATGTMMTAAPLCCCAAAAVGAGVAGIGAYTLVSRHRRGRPHSRL